MINEALIRSFLTLARTRNVTEAARRLYLSQQAVSKHLARLEEDLGCPLFTRERGSMALTEQGALYFDTFSHMEETLSAAREQADRMTSAERNQLVISHLDLLNIYRIFKPIYQKFSEQNPDVRLVYRSTSEWATVEQLLEGRVDVVFTFLQELPPLPELDHMVVVPLQELLVAAADHPLAVDGADYRDFRDEPVFYTPEPGSGNSMERRMQTLGFPIDRLVETDSILSSCSAVEMGQGVTFMTEYCRLLDGHSFRTYPTGQPATLVMAFLKSSRKPALRRFIHFVAEQRA